MSEFGDDDEYGDEAEKEVEARPEIKSNILTLVPRKLAIWETSGERVDEYGRKLCRLPSCTTILYTNKLDPETGGMLTQQGADVVKTQDIKDVPNMGLLTDWVYIMDTEEFINVEDYQRLRHNAAIKAAGKIVGTLVRTNKFKVYRGAVFNPYVHEVDEDKPGPELRRKYYNIFNPARIVQGRVIVTKLPDVLQELFSCVSGGNTEYLEQWLAFTVRHLGTPGCALILQGVHGTGKSGFGELVKHIFGPYGGAISVNELENPFNSWVENKLFIYGDELSASAVRDKDKIMNHLKKLIAGESITINRKGVPQYGYRNVSRWALFSNSDKPITIEQTERRYSILTSNQKLSLAAGAEIGRNKQKYAELLVSYLQTVDLEHFSNWTPLDNDS